MSSDHVDQLAALLRDATDAERMEALAQVYALETRNLAGNVRRVMFRFKVRDPRPRVRRTPGPQATSSRW